jgi:hypothetical protein
MMIPRLSWVALLLAAWIHFWSGQAAAYHMSRLNQVKDCVSTTLHDHRLCPTECWAVADPALLAVP